MGVDVLDILATILGVWFTLRKLDAQSRQPEAFPHVLPAAFLAWREREVSIYRVAVWACFIKVMTDLAFTHWIAPGQDPRLVRAVGATIDLSWLAVIVVTLVRSTLSRAERRRLGIVLGGPSMMQPEEDDESQRDE